VRYLLDANVVLHLANKVQGYERILARVNELEPSAARISAVTAYELRYTLGRARASRERLRELAAWLRFFKALPFVAKAAEAAATIRLALEARGTPIGPLDTLAAGHAVALGHVLVTDNVREFARVEGLRVANWLR
jgi:tRNA(fMet)-specific endonuclease VapC